MSLHVQKQLTRYPSAETWADLDLTEMCIHSFRYNASVSAPTRLSFVVESDSQTLPLNYDDFIRFWDDSAKLPDGTTDQDEDHPIFEGWIEEVTPGSGPTGVNIVAYDPTYRASRKSLVMSGPYEPDGSNFPVDSPASYPRAVWNCPTFQDPDYAFSLGQDWAVGKIYQNALDNALLALKHLNAATGSAAYSTSDTGTESAGVWTGNLTVKPEEKIVATAESPRSLLERLLSQHEPTFKLFWEPGTRLWRARKMPSLSAVTITVNDPSETVPVIASEIRRSREGRYSAVKIYGPQGVVWSNAIWGGEGSTGNTLEPLDQYSIGSVGEPAQCYWKFQITDPEFNAIGKRGPEPISVPMYYFGEVLASGDITTQLLTIPEDTWEPALIVTYPGGSRTVAMRWIDYRAGIVAIASGQCLFLFDSDATAPDRYILPTSVTLRYPNLTDPITVRSPSSGFSGTVYSVGGIEEEYKEYSESLAVDWRYGAPVTTETRLTRMQKYADSLLEERKDLVHSGAIRLHGADYRFAWLDKRVNVAAIDEAGDPLTTGWESIGAWVTDCEIDYEDMTTSVSLHTDQMELFGLDPEMLKLQLGIRAATDHRFFYDWHVFMYWNNSTKRQTIEGGVTVRDYYYDDKGGLQ